MLTRQKARRLQKKKFRTSGALGETSNKTDKIRMEYVSTDGLEKDSTGKSTTNIGQYLSLNDSHGH